MSFHFSQLGNCLLSIPYYSFSFKKFRYFAALAQQHNLRSTSVVQQRLLDLAYFGHKYQISSLSSYTSFVINNNLHIDNGNVISFLQDIEHYKLDLESEFYLIKTMCFSFLDNNMEVLFKSTNFIKKYEVRILIKTICR